MAIALPVLLGALVHDCANPISEARAHVEDVYRQVRKVRHSLRQLSHVFHALMSVKGQLAGHGGAAPARPTAPDPSGDSEHSQLQADRSRRSGRTSGDRVAGDARNSARRTCAKRERTCTAHHDHDHCATRSARRQPMAFNLFNIDDWMARPGHGLRHWERHSWHTDRRWPW